MLLNQKVYFPLGGEKTKESPCCCSRLLQAEKFKRTFPMTFKCQKLFLMQYHRDESKCTGGPAVFILGDQTQEPHRL